MAAAPETNLDLKAALYLCKSALVRLQQLSDADRWQPKVEGKAAKWASRGKADPTAVAAAKEASTGTVPSKQFSLWAHYSHRMNEAARSEDVILLTKLAACALRDYESQVGRRQSRQHVGHELTVDDLLRNYQGVNSIEAAWMLETSEKWVRRQRILNGRDADYGNTQNHDAITTKILRMSASGSSVRVIAMEVGLSKSSVQRRIEATLKESA